MTTQESLAALSQDLYRVATGLYKDSDKMAAVFFKSAIKIQHDIDKNSIPTYLQKILNSLPHVVLDKDKKQTAELFLMWSVQVQNYVKTRNV